MTDQQRILFVAGAPRSGTTAIVNLLNCHQRILLLKERYSRLLLREQALLPAHFAEQRMFTFEEGDSFYNAIAPETPDSKLRARHPNAAYIGDKIPKLYEHMDWIAQNFDEATLIFMSRNIFDVAASYNRRARDPDDKRWPVAQDFRVAIQDWNTSNQALMKAAKVHSNINFIGVDYETIFFDPASFKRLLERLALNDDGPVNRQKLEGIYRGAAKLETQRSDALTSHEKRFLCLQADLDAYRELHAAIPWID